MSDGDSAVLGQEGKARGAEASGTDRVRVGLPEYVAVSQALRRRGTAGC